MVTSQERWVEGSLCATLGTPTTCSGIRFFSSSFLLASLDLSNTNVNGSYEGLRGFRGRVVRVVRPLGGGHFEGREVEGCDIKGKGVRRLCLGRHLWELGG